MHMFFQWFYVHLGFAGGAYTNAWGGFVSDLGLVAWFGAAYGLARKHNCHVKGCWRIGKHPVDGTPYIVCKKHHPTIDEHEKVTAASIAQAQVDALDNTASSE